MVLEVSSKNNLFKAVSSVYFSLIFHLGAKRLSHDCDPNQPDVLGNRFFFFLLIACTQSRMCFVVEMPSREKPLYELRCNRTCKTDFT